MAVRDEFIAALSERGDQLRAVIVERRVDDGRGRQREFIEEIETAPRAHAQCILAPRVIQHIGFGHHRTDRRPQSFAERKVLDVEADIDREPRAVRPAINRAVFDR